MSLFSFGSFIVSLPSIKGGVGKNLLFFISFCKILNFFFGEIKLLFMVALTELKNANFVRLFANVD